MNGKHPIVLDACAIIAYLRNEAGADVVEKLLEEEPPVCIAHAINVCEVFYDFCRVGGEQRALGALQDIRTVGIGISEEMDQAFWQQAGRYKVAYRMSLADAFALALAERYSAELVTSDRREFGPVADKGIIPIRFFR